jgi:DNA-binding Xre family transcriptional regulator
MFNISQKYIPLYLSKKDKLKQKNMILKSRKLYKSKKYFTRKNVSSFKSKPSKHIINAKRIYNINKISPSRELAKKTGCSLQALNKIVKKGEGAYYSSGSRPNQTPQSWGLARLASAVTGGKASKVDFSILKEGCSHSGKAFRLAQKA